MRTDTLFAEIALRAVAHPENIATEALRYVLKAHPRAWPALRAFLRLGGTELPERLAFKTQALGPDNAIPDMTGMDRDGNDVLLIEAKFWAGLTPNQPVTYLERLPDDRPAMLLVVAPGMRISTLWEKLVDLCSKGGIRCERKAEVAPEFWTARVADAQQLGIVSWRAALQVLQQEAERTGDHPFLNDVSQLAGLCDKMDGESFVPLSAREISPEIGRRVQQLADLVDEVVPELVRKHGARTDGLTTGGSQSAYGRYFIHTELAGFFCYSPSLWARYGEPMWLRVAKISKGDWRSDSRITDSISALYASRPGHVVEDAGLTTVAIELPLSVERPDVIAEVTRQVVTIMSHAGAAMRDSAPASPGDHGH